MNALNKKSVEDLDVKGKRVLVRCDFNVPLKDGEITNDKRIVAALPTIKYLMEQGAKVILCSHLGRPKGEYKPEFSLAPVAKRLSEYLGVDVPLAEDENVVGDNAKKMVADLQDGQVMLAGECALPCRGDQERGELLQGAGFFGRSVCERRIRHCTPCPLLHHRCGFLPAGRLWLFDPKGDPVYGWRTGRSQAPAGCHSRRR